MKIKLFLALFMGLTIASYSQIALNPSDAHEPQKYTVITKENDTISVYGPKVNIDFINRGFEEYDKKGQPTGGQINPINDSKILYNDNDGKTITLKSVTLPKKISGVFFENPFMFSLIENSEQDLKKGKIDFYVLQYTKEPLIESQSDINQASSEGRNYYKPKYAIKIKYYFKDSNGLHQIDYKRQFKLYPEILGKEVFEKMKQSNKSRKQFLLDYFTEYNRKIDTSLVANEMI
ncbi:hypothetical protein [Aureibaculum luteum]|uniref:hypothetical protein n=1 Tax=Aureibaculum luteum TaxID=1548456 RepID=UPI000E543891|nr:hypothetical protein [Aureibaculum luteum]